MTEGMFNDKEGTTERRGRKEGRKWREKERKKMKGKRIKESELIFDQRLRGGWIL